MKINYMMMSKTKDGELAGKKRYISDKSGKGITPFFDLTPPDEEKSPLQDTDRKISRVLDTLSVDVQNFELFPHNFQRQCFIDNNFWEDANATLENKTHPIEHFYSRLVEHSVNVIPVVGLERWDEEEAPAYVRGIKNIRQSGCETFCLRVPKDFIEEAKSEPDYFLEQIELVISELDINSGNTYLLLDFESIADYSPIDMAELSENILEVLSSHNFLQLILAGGSIPQYVSDVVSKKNSSKTIQRTEILAWKTLSRRRPNLLIGFADYGVRPPESPDNVAGPHINSKIYFTTEEQYLVARGSSLKGKKGCDRTSEFQKLASMIIRSGHLLTTSTNWADQEIIKSIAKPSADFGYWIEVSTYRHASIVVQEVFEHINTLTPVHA